MFPVRDFFIKDPGTKKNDPESSYQILKVFFVITINKTTFASLKGGV